MQSLAEGIKAPKAEMLLAAEAVVAAERLEEARKDPLKVGAAVFGIVTIHCLVSSFHWVCL